VLGTQAAHLLAEDDAQLAGGAGCFETAELPDSDGTLVVVSAAP
jgi:hypothetical protein